MRAKASGLRGFTRPCAWLAHQRRTNTTAEGAVVRPRLCPKAGRHPPGLSRFTAGVSHGRVGRLAGVAPLNRLRAVQAQSVGEGFRDVEVAARNVRAAVDHLREDFLSVEADVDLHPAGEHRM